MKSDNEPSKVPRIRLISGALFIFIITATAYSPVLKAGYIWDDNAHVSQNPNLKNVEGLRNIWLEPGEKVQYYPLVFTVFWLQYRLWGADPPGYHLFNVLLHIINALMVWSVLRRLKIQGAFYCAVIFALHPVQVESVAWITELKNLLSTLFYLLSIRAYLSYCLLDDDSQKSHRSNILPYFLSLFFFVCALLSKTVTCTLPASILLLIWWKKDKINGDDIKKVLPFFVLGAILALKTAALEKNNYGTVGPDWDFTFVERILIAARAIWFYIGKILLPIRLTFSYPRFDIDASQWWQYTYLFTTIAVLLALWIRRKKIGKGPLTAIMFFIITISPALGFINFFTMLYSFVADHYQYLASIGTISLLTAVIMKLDTRGTHTPAMSNAVFAVIFIVYGTLTWHQCRIYENQLTLYNDIIEKNPKSWFAYNNRGVYLGENGDVKMALADFNAAINLKSHFILYENRADLYFKMKEYPLSIADYSKAIELNPVFESLYNNRGTVYMSLKEYELALADFHKAAHLKEDFAKPLMNIGIVHALRKDYQKALKYFNQAIDVSEDEAALYYNRALVYQAMGESALAQEDAKKAASLGYFN